MTLGFRDLILLNDFEANGFAVPVLNPANIIMLKGEKIPTFKENFKILLVGPGTGLGVCMVHHR